MKTNETSVGREPFSYPNKETNALIASSDVFLAHLRQSFPSTISMRLVEEEAEPERLVLGGGQFDDDQFFVAEEKKAANGKKDQLMMVTVNTYGDPIIVAVNAQKKTASIFLSKNCKNECIEKKHRIMDGLQKAFNISCTFTTSTIH